MKFYGIEIVTPTGSPIPSSSAIEVNGLVFLSGVLALRDGKIVEGIEGQTEVVFDAITTILGQANLNLNHVIKTTIWLTDPSDFAAFNSVYSKRFRPPFPSRSCVISRLVLPGARVEVEVVASRNDVRV